MATVRRYARWALVILTALFILAIVVQILTAGFAIFGATSFDLHESLGFTLTHGLSILVLVAALVAWIGRSGIVLAFLVAALTTIQVILPQIDSGWIAGLHPLTAFVLVVLGYLLLRSPATSPSPR